MAAPAGGLAILVDEKRVNELLQQKSGLKALLRSTFNTILFVCFLLLFTSLALAEPRYKMRAFEGYLRKRFDEAAPVRLADVFSVDGFWMYHNESFMPAVYGQDTAKYSYPGAVVPTWLQVDGPNYLYGLGRIRILNVKPNSDCQVAPQFQNYFSTCYGPFSSDAVDTETYGPMNNEGVPSFNYQPNTGDEYLGVLARYPSGGYIDSFTPDYLTSNAKFQVMRNDAGCSTDLVETNLPPGVEGSQGIRLADREIGKQNPMVVLRKVEPRFKRGSENVIKHTRGWGPPLLSLSP